MSRKGKEDLKGARKYHLSKNIDHASLKPFLILRNQDKRGQPE